MTLRMDVTVVIFFKKAIWSGSTRLNDNLFWKFDLPRLVFAIAGRREEGAASDLFMEEVLSAWKTLDDRRKAVGEYQKALAEVNCSGGNERMTVAVA